MDMDDHPYATIRDHIGYLVGKRLVDITQHDAEDFDPDDGSGCFVCLHFEDGSWLKFNMGVDIGGCDFEHQEG